MGDSSEGSSSAAHGALDENPRSWMGDLWARVTGREDGESDDTKVVEPQFTPSETQTMLRNVRDMRNIRIDAISIPRADIVAVPLGASLEEVVEIFRECTFTRLPVFAETLDNPIGMIHLKDLALDFGFGAGNGTFDLEAISRPLIYVPPSMPVDVLLQKMQTERTHMALVIDEYGGVDGLLTIEDLLEQVVGEIVDEHDTEEVDLWTEEASGVYLCSSRAPLQEFEKIAGVDLLSDDLDEDVETLGGLVFMLAGRVPVRGEIVAHPQGHEFEVVDADPRSLKRVRVRLDTANSLDQAAE
ncbi:hemolysin family protein [Algicella marina]|uniref:CBS domain-containing protein n=1 Tax=Algicella marina TaxID=2683284 RepID=A0A6P1SZR1_9RHOB|nr:hemolysin family protein [Algicella marina]QHQ36164.1 CBS domain-containing protein [Algicella marina]